MPYIQVNTSKKLSPEQRDQLAAALGERISIIPGKVEKGLMVDIVDGRHMYYAGHKADAAFVEIRCFGTTAYEAQKAYAVSVFEVLESQLGLGKGQVYFNHVDMLRWGSGGALREY